MTTSTRTRLLELSTQLMRRQGYHATGLTQLLREAEVPKGSFYHYFPSKEALAQAIIRQYGDELSSGLAAFMQQSSGPWLHRLRQYFDYAIQLLAVQPELCNCLLGTLAQELAQAEPALAQELDQQYRRLERHLAGILADAQANGELPPGLSPEPMARVLFSSWQGCLIRARLEHSVQPLQDCLELYFTRVLHA